MLRRGPAGADVGATAAAAVAPEPARPPRRRWKLWGRKRDDPTEGVTGDARRRHAHGPARRRRHGSGDSCTWTWRTTKTRCSPKQALEHPSRCAESGCPASWTPVRALWSCPSASPMQLGVPRRREDDRALRGSAQGDARPRQGRRSGNAGAPGDLPGRRGAQPQRWRRSGRSSWKTWTWWSIAARKPCTRAIRTASLPRSSDRADVGPVPRRGTPRDPLVNDAWIADRMRHIEASGIRKVFDLAKAMNDPINLSIGQPDFDVPDPVKAAADRRHRARAATPTPSPRASPSCAAGSRPPSTPSSATPTARCSSPPAPSAALLLALLLRGQPRRRGHRLRPVLRHVPHLVTLAGGTPVLVDTYPDFRIDAGRVAAAITPRTKCILVNSPANPTGVVASADEMRGLAELCRERDILLDQRRGLPRLLLRPPVRHARPRATRTSWSSTASARRTA